MDIFKASERLMGLDDTEWAHHASPWSVYTRFTILPLLTVTTWARDALGWWILLPVAAIVVWIWANPRVFPKPATTNNWASKGTFGERVFLNRAALPVPDHHRHWAFGLSFAAGLGLIPLVWGIIAYDVGLTPFGMALSMGAKIWFVDRMVWLYEDMKEADPVYRAWLR
ncbi:DUF6653 family protein [Ovoidimarina sediminis]|uniref:DUF6653 family protein n=1 Tax=Ovoidimarina sediminis TaxID=3079856 RepID=UPI00293142C0|nr:DUF6653 family protein [Rhodophyticola sp. MJ-SS7]